MAERELKTRITASDETKGPIESATASFELLGKKIEGLNKPLEAIKGLFATVAATVVGEFVKSTVEAAAEAEQAWARVESALENAGIGARHVHGDLETLFESMAKTSRFSEKDLSGAFATLLNVTNDYGGSVKNLELVANIAIARQMDLSQAATLVGRVMDGNTSMLKRYGIVLREDGVDPMTQLTERFNGFAERDATTLSGALAKIGNDFEKVKERIGEALMGDGARGGLAGFDASLVSLGDWIKEHHADLQMLSNDLAGIVSALVAIPEAVAKLPGAHWILSRLGQKKEDIDTFSAEVPSVAVGAPNPMQEAVQKELEIEANARKVAAEKEAARVKAEIAELKKHLGDTEGGFESPELQAIIKGYKKLGYDPENTPGAVSNQLYQATQLTKLGQGLAAMLAQANPQARGTSGDAQANIHATSADQVKALLVDPFKVELPKAIDVAQNSIRGFFSEWGSLIDTVIEHHGKLGKAIVDTGRHAIGAVMSAQGQAALLKAGEAAAEGLWPPNPALLLKAARLLGVGTAELALGSILGGGGGGGGSSGGGGGSSIGASSFANAPGSRRTTVVFKGRRQVYDMSDPEDRALFVAAIKAVAGDGDIDFIFDAA